MLWAILGISEGSNANTSLYYPKRHIMSFPNKGSRFLLIRTVHSGQLLSNGDSDNIRGGFWVGSSVLRLKLGVAPLPQ